MVILDFPSAEFPWKGLCSESDAIMLEVVNIFPLSLTSSSVTSSLNSGLHFHKGSCAYFQTKKPNAYPTFSMKDSAAHPINCSYQLLLCLHQRELRLQPPFSAENNRLIITKHAELTRINQLYLLSPPSMWQRRYKFTCFYFLTLTRSVQHNNMQSSDEKLLCKAERKQQIVIWLPQPWQKELIFPFSAFSSPIEASELMSVLQEESQADVFIFI